MLETLLNYYKQKKAKKPDLDKLTLLDENLKPIPKPKKQNVFVAEGHRLEKYGVKDGDTVIVDPNRKYIGPGLYVLKDPQGCFKIRYVTSDFTYIAFRGNTDEEYEDIYSEDDMIGKVTYSYTI